MVFLFLVRVICFLCTFRFWRHRGITPGPGLAWFWTSRKWNLCVWTAKMQWIKRDFELIFWPFKSVFSVASIEQIKAAFRIRNILVAASRKFVLTDKCFWNPKTLYSEYIMSNSKKFQVPRPVQFRCCNTRGRAEDGAGGALTPPPTFV